MKYGIYVIRDVHTGFFSPTADVNDQTAIRNFEHAVSQGQSLMFTHPEDYSLYKIGEFDSDTGELSGILPEVKIHATEVKL